MKQEIKQNSQLLDEFKIKFEQIKKLKQPVYQGFMTSKNLPTQFYQLKYLIREQLLQESHIFKSQKWDGIKKKDNYFTYQKNKNKNYDYIQMNMENNIDSLEIPQENYFNYNNNYPNQNQKQIYQQKQNSDNLGFSLDGNNSLEKYNNNNINNQNNNNRGINLEQNNNININYNQFQAYNQEQQQYQQHSQSNFMSSSDNIYKESICSKGNQQYKNSEKMYSSQNQIEISKIYHRDNFHSKNNSHLAFTPENKNINYNNSINLEYLQNQRNKNKSPNTSSLNASVINNQLIDENFGYQTNKINRNKNIDNNNIQDQVSLKRKTFSDNFYINNGIGKKEIQLFNLETKLNSNRQNKILEKSQNEYKQHQQKNYLRNTQTQDLGFKDYTANESKYFLLNLEITTQNLIYIIGNDAQVNKNNKSNNSQSNFNLQQQSPGTPVFSLPTSVCDRSPITPLKFNQSSSEIFCIHNNTNNYNNTLTNNDQNNLNKNDIKINNQSKFENLDSPLTIQQNQVQKQNIGNLQNSPYQIQSSLVQRSRTRSRDQEQNSIKNFQGKEPNQFLNDQQNIIKQQKQLKSNNNQKHQLIINKNSYKQNLIDNDIKIQRKNSQQQQQQSLQQVQHIDEIINNSSSQFNSYSHFQNSEMQTQIQDEENEQNQNKFLNQKEYNQKQNTELQCLRNDLKFLLDCQIGEIDNQNKIEQMCSDQLNLSLQSSSSREQEDSDTDQFRDHLSSGQQDIRIKQQLNDFQVKQEYSNNIDLDIFPQQIKPSDDNNIKNLDNIQKLNQKYFKKENKYQDICSKTMKMQISGQQDFQNGSQTLYNCLDNGLDQPYNENNNMSKSQQKIQEKNLQRNNIEEEDQQMVYSLTNPQSQLNQEKIQRTNSYRDLQENQYFQQNLQKNQNEKTTQRQGDQQILKDDQLSSNLIFNQSNNISQYIKNNQISQSQDQREDKSANEFNYTFQKNLNKNDSQNQNILGVQKQLIANSQKQIDDNKMEFELNINKNQQNNQNINGFYQQEGDTTSNTPNVQNYQTSKDVNILQQRNRKQYNSNYIFEND
ncbi:hypothetical protein PPERSA_07470 [Pseudocohnilembus persalinus]|uniref:Uncharacterized protein n=1 Tax=Pseudocohnilembus persalinus TaxID=266149 RepID=A0A0V0R297_PSEPJ|nr:hypothetical protein PPERSA_07470 [Pseudocohnilembus persalinus]|eukprot:KRX08658.1 hypothetical protein PPERSA_07470 [Pseudocohnilembus persalinus]